MAFIPILIAGVALGVGFAAVQRRRQTDDPNRRAGVPDQLTPTDASRRAVGKSAWMIPGGL
ncbi:MAG TPA: hypothetical protein VN200_07480 [Rhodoglobus sp.]|nr:hypothetical protein [Rhodoglobus sp.]